jgi:hypothetical protein
MPKKHKCFSCNSDFFLFSHSICAFQVSSYVVRPVSPDMTLLSGVRDIGGVYKNPWYKMSMSAKWLAGCNFNILLLTLDVCFCLRSIKIFTIGTIMIMLLGYVISAMVKHFSSVLSVSLTVVRVNF